MEKALHFKSKQAYMKWNSFRFIHGVNKGGHNPVFIHGMKHKVMH